MTDEKIREALDAALEVGAMLASGADLEETISAIRESARVIGGERARVLLGADAALEQAEGAVPIEAGGERLGVLLPAAPAAGEDAARFLRLLAQQVALAVRLARLRERETAEMNVDPATRLLDRRGFDLALRREVERAYRTAQPLATVVVDLDRFESVERLHGAEAAGAVLRMAADALRVGLRQIDVAARTGASQFRALLPGSQSPGAREVAERLRCAIAASVVPGAGVLTATCGIAALPEHAANGAGLVQAADAAVSLGQRRGRNCVVVARPLRGQGS